MPELVQLQKKAQTSQMVAPRKPGQASVDNTASLPHARWAPGNQALQKMLHSQVIQAKLEIRQPNDQYEREADRMAEQVMRMSDPLKTGPTYSSHSQDVSIHRTCSECDEEELHRQPLNEEETEKIFRTRGTPGYTPHVTSELESQIDSLRGGGQPLSGSVRAFFEPRFGQDFSQVRIHADSQASELARGVNARAFTLGQDVVFGAGEYEPETSKGQKLLSHELTHVIQQNADIAIGRLSRITSPRIQLVGICAPNECQQGARRRRDPGGNCAIRGRRCLGCITPGIEPCEDRRNRDSRHYMLWYCPDSLDLLLPMPILYERGGTNRDVGWDHLCRDLRRWSSRGVRVFGFASPESTGPYRNDWMAAHRAIMATSQLQVACSLPRDSIHPYLERTNLGLGVTNEYGSDPTGRANNRFVWIEPVQARSIPDQPQRDEWACHPTGEADWVMMIPYGSGFFIEKQVVTLAHRPNQTLWECRDFRYVGAGSELDVSYIFDLARSIFHLLSEISQIPRQSEQLIQELVDQLEGLSIDMWNQIRNPPEWDCWSFRRLLNFSDWQTRGSRQTGPIYAFGSAHGGRSPGGLLRPVPFSFSGLDLPGIGGSSGIFQVPLGQQLIDIARILAPRLRQIYNNTPNRVFEELSERGIDRERIEAIVRFLECIVDWTSNPNQVDDWTQLGSSESCELPCSLNCPLFGESRLGR